MTFDEFDAQATLLYAEAPEIDFENFAALAADWCAMAGLGEVFTPVPAASDGASRCFVGNGVHVSVTVHTQPIDTVAFALPLRSPVLKHKEFDFAHAIDMHRAAVVITVGEGETPSAPDAANSMADVDHIGGTHRFAKLGALQMALQVLARTHPPLMVDFGPSQSLLSPQEIAEVSDLSLPVPILIHPFPFRRKTTDGKTRRGIAAIHAQHLIGAELELEAVPADMSMAERIRTLTTLVQLKMEDAVPLAHGDSLETDEGAEVWIRHEEGSIEDGPPRIIVSFDTRAPEQTTSQNQQSFQDRIAQLKKGGSKDARPETLPADAQVYRESEEELHARVQATISPDENRTGGRRRVSAPMLLVVLTAIGIYLFLSLSGEQLETLASAFGDPLAEAESQPRALSTSRLIDTGSTGASGFGKTVSVAGQGN